MPTVPAPQAPLRHLTSYEDVDDELPAHLLEGPSPSLDLVVRSSSTPTANAEMPLTTLSPCLVRDSQGVEVWTTCPYPRGLEQSSLDQASSVLGWVANVGTLSKPVILIAAAAGYAFKVSPPQVYDQLEKEWVGAKDDWAVLESIQRENPDCVPESYQPRIRKVSIHQQRLQNRMTDIRLEYRSLGRVGRWLGGLPAFLQVRAPVVDLMTETMDEVFQFRTQCLTSSTYLRGLIAVQETVAIGKPLPQVPPVADDAGPPDLSPPGHELLRAAQLDPSGAELLHLRAMTVSVVQTTPVSGASAPADADITDVANLV